MSHPAEYAIFGILLLATIGPGLFFSLRRTGHQTLDEVFLGSRTLAAIPLALSALASLLSSAGLIAFTAHYYAYGIHMAWSFITVQFCLPFTVHIIVPVLYRLKITSLFEYLRARYGRKISLTACTIYFILTQSLGAVAIFSAAMAVATIFQVPFIWCCLAIGFTGTFYTALGGLRGVVWTDCVQGVITIVAPITIIVKILYDSNSGHFKLRPLNDINLRAYLFDASLDFTKDENVWSCLIGVAAGNLYRTGLDQMIVQRYMASRTLEDAKRTARAGIVMLTGYYIIHILMSLLLIYWFRDCDPQLTGAIKRIDQLLPYYIKRHLSEFTGFSGLFLAGAVSASTSTISSIINSQAVVLYIDVVSQYFVLADVQATRITKVLAFVIGIIMTLFSIVIPYLGSATRILLMVSSAVSGPFVGLFLSALMFPCVNSKGAGVATLLTTTFQLWHMSEKLRLGVRPPRMPVTMDYCPGNITRAMNISSNAFFQTPRT
ncbi:sodium-coupled monocarboxylate transporter 2 [Ixodes scapularis]|uniref:sodium-coupled monocarboxylate transporter 2 n=1 Tax=Ixodes scapularis TaxID=6945 RepID=UPI001C393DA9|nr:sodium-coupled monocarboxylate transporter 2 [Ixodes scapularis]